MNEYGCLTTIQQRSLFLFTAYWLCSPSAPSPFDFIDSGYLSLGHNAISMQTAHQKYRWQVLKCEHDHLRERKLEPPSTKRVFFSHNTLMWLFYIILRIFCHFHVDSSLWKSFFTVSPSDWTFVATSIRDVKTGDSHLSGWKSFQQNVPAVRKRCLSQSPIQYFLTEHQAQTGWKTTFVFHIPGRKRNVLTGSLMEPELIRSFNLLFYSSSFLLILFDHLNPQSAN